MKPMKQDCCCILIPLALRFLHSLWTGNVWFGQANSYLWLKILASPEDVRLCCLAAQIVILLHESQQWRKLVREEGELWRNLSREIVHDIGFI